MMLVTLWLACDAPETKVEPMEAAPVALVTPRAPTANRPKPDATETSAGVLTIHPIGHGSVAFEFGGKTWMVDPAGQPGGDYAGLKADVILITDIHPDHMDKAQVAAVSKPDAVIVAPAAVQKDLGDVDVMIANGESKDVAGVKVEAVPMYNLVRGPEAGKLYHEKGRGNGYIVTFGDKRVYLSGDTECTPEMKALTEIDVAFVCMNLPYTMTPEEAAGCVAAFDPKVIYPYHYGESDLAKFSAALEAEQGKDAKAEGQVAHPVTSEIRVRDWYMKK